MRVGGTLAIFILTIAPWAHSQKTTSIPFDASVESIFKILQQRSVGQLESAIELFDPYFFKMGNFRLFFNSRSIQPGTKQFPRVVLVGKNQKLFVSFNHKLGENRNLEIIQFREQDQKWEFREIAFPNGHAKLSSSNPKMCLQCHGEPNAQPNMKRFDAARLELSLPFPSYGSLVSFESQPFWSDFLRRAQSDKIYSKLELPTLK